MYKTVNPGLHSEAGALMPLFELFWTYYIVNTRSCHGCGKSCHDCLNVEARKRWLGRWQLVRRKKEGNIKRRETDFLVCSERKRKENRFFLSLHKVHSNPNVVALM
jgi:hypothetical protein